jgi:MFS transporter, PHS family, inorganic phosphate transporter
VLLGEIIFVLISASHRVAGADCDLDCGDMFQNNNEPLAGSSYYSTTLNDTNYVPKSVGAFGKSGKRKKRLRPVKSGIGISALGDQHDTPSSSAGWSLTSRTARVLLAGAGFLADAYDLFVINLVLRLLRDEYPEYTKTGQIGQLQGAVASAALFGAIFGQLVAGSLADVVGRKVIFVATAALIMIGSIMSAFSNETTYMTVYGHIACWRFVLGAGVGGEYPLAATVTSESTTAARRGALMASVFAMQGMGSLLSVLVVLLCLSFGCSSGFTWRFSLAFGAVPVLIAFPWRIRMHETETFERVKMERTESQQHLQQLLQQSQSQGGSSHSDSNMTMSSSGVAAAASVTQSRSSEMMWAFRFYKWHMAGTALSWFLLDVVFYANGLFNHDVTEIILSNGKPTNALQDAWNSMFICIVGKMRPNQINRCAP